MKKTAPPQNTYSQCSSGTCNPDSKFSLLALWPLLKYSFSGLLLRNSVSSCSGWCYMLMSLLAHQDSCSFLLTSCKLARLIARKSNWQLIGCPYIYRKKTWDEILLNFLGGATPTASRSSGARDWNLCHSFYMSHSSDNTGSLTHCTTKGTAPLNFRTNFK